MNSEKGLEGNDDHRHGGLTISFGVPRMVFEDNPFQNDDGFGVQMNGGHMGGMLRRMNDQMNQMLSSMKTSMSSMMSKDPFQDMPTLGAGSSGGKMYIMESGPGYHEEKSYDIGPNGKMTLIDNDMSKFNVFNSLYFCPVPIYLSEVLITDNFFWWENVF